MTKPNTLHQKVAGLQIDTAVASSPSNESAARSPNRGGWKTVHVSAAAGHPAGKATPPSTPATYDAHAAWLAKQRESVRRHRQEQHARFVERHETAAAAAVPLRLRVLSLLGEAHRFERAQSASRADSIRVARATHSGLVDMGYRNLVTDVRRRCAVIEASGAGAAQQHSIGGEAVSCFSTVLPWSWGIVIVTMPNGKLTPDIPQRLSQDMSKLEACTKAMRDRLQKLTSVSSTPCTAAHPCASATRPRADQLPAKPASSRRRRRVAVGTARVE